MQTGQTGKGSSLAKLDGTSIVEILFLVQQFVVPVQQNLIDQGLRVPTLTPVVE
jgi:hypothetical protein